ncbi:MAG: TauD/TfdA family dioxygenase [Burkholderiales bacterium]
MDGRRFCRCNRTCVESSQRFPDVPRLTDAQKAAMDAVDTLCEDSELVLDMRLERGDMQFISHCTVLHSRTPCESRRSSTGRRAART